MSYRTTHLSFFQLSLVSSKASLTDTLMSSVIINRHVLVPSVRTEARKTKVLKTRKKISQSVYFEQKSARTRSTTKDIGLSITVGKNKYIKGSLPECTQR